MKTLSNLFLFLFFLFSNFLIIGQNSVSFSAPDMVCTGEVLDIEYTGTGGESFCWISSPLFDEVPYVRDVVGFQTGKKPHYSDVIKTNGNYHIFVAISNYIDGSNGDLVRLDFGNSLENQPTVNLIELGIIPYGQEGIQVIQEDDTWWGFLIGTTHFVRLNFGNDITSIPTIENLGPFGSLIFPHELFITYSEQEWLGIFIDKGLNSMYRLIFGNSLANDPILELIPTSSLDSPTGFHILSDENNWYMFVTDKVHNSLTRFEFGNSLFTNPIEIDLGNLGVLNEPRDISIFSICNQYCGIVLNRGDSSLIKLDFNNSIQNTPTIFPFGNFTGYSFPHSITEGYLSENGLHFFFSNVETNDYKDLVFPFGESNNTICNNTSTPPQIAYDTFGIQTLLVVVDEGTPYQSSACKQIVVEYSPPLNLGKDTAICFGNTLLLETEFPETIWQGQELGNSFQVKTEGIYYAEIAEGNCTSKDTIQVEVEDCEQCFEMPNIFTPNDDNVNDFFQPVLNCPATINDFSFQIFNRWGNMVFETNDFEIGWDGKQNGKHSPADVYVWKINYSIQIDKVSFEKSNYGDVTLVR